VAVRVRRVTAAAARADDDRYCSYDEGSPHWLGSVSVPNNAAVPMSTLFLPLSAPHGPM
jgi:hypothetical protein